MSTPPLAASTPFSISYGLPEPATPGTSLYLPSFMSEADETSATRIEFESIPRPVGHLNAFLKSRDISPIWNTLRTPWDEASDRTGRQQEEKLNKLSQLFLMK